MWALADKEVCALSFFSFSQNQTSRAAQGLQREKLRLPISFIFYLLLNISHQYEQHIDLQREKLRLLKTEFEGIKDDLDKHGDKYVDKYLDKGAWPRKIMNRLFHLKWSKTQIQI